MLAPLKLMHAHRDLKKKFDSIEVCEVNFFDEVDMNLRRLGRRPT